MRMLRLAAFQIAWLALALGACRTSVAGRYELELTQTKLCVAQSALDSPDDAEMKEATIKLLGNTQLDLLLDDAGKMTSTTTLIGEGAGAPQKRDGTWKMDGKRVVMKVNGVADTLCDVDGNLLRCEKPTPGTLFSKYVLVKK